MHDSSQKHWTMVKWLLRFLKDTIYYGLHLCRNQSLDLHAFFRRIRLTILMISPQHQPILFIYEAISYLGPLKSKHQLLDLLLKSSIVLLLQQLLSSYGFSLFSKNLLLRLQPHLSIVTIWAPLTFVPIRSFIYGWTTLPLIFILCGTRLPPVFSVFLIFPLMTSLLIFLRNHCPWLVMINYVSSWCLQWILCLAGTC